MGKEVFINPLTDFGFKRIFGEERNKALLINFLNEIIEEERKIVDIEYQSTFQTGIQEQNRKAVFDIFCKNDRGELFIVEMQKAKRSYFVDRSLFYSSFAIQKQAVKGKWDFNLKAVYAVAILDFNLFDEMDGPSDFYIERIHLVRERTGEKYSNKLNLIFVELPKFQKELHELTTNFKRWLYCLKNLPKLESQPEEVRGEIFDELFQEASINKLTEQDMETYRKSILEYDDVRDAVAYAEETYYKKGWREKAIAVATKLAARHFPISDISQITGMTPEEVKTIAAEE
ncbi:MAG: Rpn family recombination-promoting nuclease/putative transposase [Dysgonamonadaceae bacterium]|jgi:predicted transposase/invertase (TIGR01784 family)|nr:Rpn family recombination-promoting nuclease/putative transposase [Dysgonamonadaceae bacterium]